MSIALVLAWLLVLGVAAVGVTAMVLLVTLLASAGAGRTGER